MTLPLPFARQAVIVRREQNLFIHETTVCSKEWAAARLREKADRDSNYNFLLRQSEKELNAYTLVYLKPSHRESAFLPIRRRSDNGCYYLGNDSDGQQWTSIQELISYYQKSGSDESVFLQRCVAPANPSMSPHHHYQ